MAPEGFGAFGAVGGLFIHDLVGLFVTPLGWGLMYYFVPILLRKPIWSLGWSEAKYGEAPETDDAVT